MDLPFGYIVFPVVTICRSGLKADFGVWQNRNRNTVLWHSFCSRYYC